VVVAKSLPDAIFRRCVEDSSDAIMLTSTDGRLCYVNRSWIRLYGYSSEEALGRQPSLLHSGHHDAQFYKSMWLDILSPQKASWSGEVVNRAKDGSLKTVLLTITPYYAAEGSGALMGFMGLAVDQSAVLEMKQRLLRQDKLALLGTLASALAHEIGTPLGVMRGRAEMLAQVINQDAGARLSARCQKHTSAILDQVDRVSEVMERILGFARTTASTSEGRESLGPRKPLQTVLDDVEALVDAHFRHAAVELEISSTVVGLSTNSASALEQILINLLVNAVRALVNRDSSVAASNPLSGGVMRRVRVEIHACASSAVGSFEQPATSEGWIIAVEDSGPGVRPELREKIFEPFYTTDPLHGTGIGLAISSKIAHDLGGRLELALPSPSGLGLGGARFELRLPADVIQVSSEHGAPAGTRPYSRSLR
jgi:PAS domain S-box-containing protein